MNLFAILTVVTAIWALLWIVLAWAMWHNNDDVTE
jgi:hypothetical protein